MQVKTISTFVKVIAGSWDGASTDGTRAFDFPQTTCALASLTGHCGRRPICVKCHTGASKQEAYSTLKVPNRTRQSRYVDHASSKEKIDLGGHGDVRRGPVEFQRQAQVERSGATCGVIIFNGIEDTSQASERRQIVSSQENVDVDG